MKSVPTRLFFWVAFILLVTAFIMNLNLGSVYISFREIIHSIFDTGNVADNRQYIVLQHRLPKAIAAVLVGSGLALGGLLMQTLFRNPLADPFVLGLSSGASLGVALLFMGSGLLSGILAGVFMSSWSIILAASIGSFLVMLAVIAASFRMKNTMGLLIIGIMFASLAGAVVSVLAYFSTSEQLQNYVFWSFGSLGNLSWTELGILSITWLTGLGLSLFCLKGLNALLLGEKYARSVGANIKQNRLLIIAVTSLLTGSITAFAGPIAFVGLAVPHVVRSILPRNDHFILMPAVLLTGAIIMLICDSIAQLPGTVHTLPLNAVTSIFGAPVVIWLLLRKKKLVF